MITLDAPKFPAFYHQSKCPHCGHDVEHPCFLRESGKHESDVFCERCGKHIGFASKERKQGKRPNKHKKIVKQFSRGYCQICLCLVESLPKGESLEGHHVLEFQSDGPDVTIETSMVICSTCHELIGWRRRQKARELGIKYEILVANARIRHEVQSSGMVSNSDSAWAETADP